MCSEVGYTRLFWGLQNGRGAASLALQALGDILIQRLSDTSESVFKVRPSCKSKDKPGRLNLCSLD